MNLKVSLGATMEDIDSNIRSKNFEKKTQRKLKRLQHLISNDAGIVCSNDPTKVKNIYLFIPFV